MLVAAIATASACSTAGEVPSDAATAAGTTALDAPTPGSTASTASTRALDTDRKVIEAVGANRRAVVAEGDFEPRSLGSYSIRVYDPVDPQYPYDRYLAGRVMPREGTLESVRWAEVDGDRTADLVVIVRSVGTGSFLHGDAFTERNGTLEPIAAVRGLAKDADVLGALRSPQAALARPKAAP
jgi:hypothetical protein